jgi:hypothetical protein
VPTIDEWGEKEGGKREEEERKTGEVEGSR